MNEMTHRPSIEAPQLRTLLLTDLCDSTSLVERIGDVAAATLFRDHDRLVLDLQQRWRGRLIDRSDGMLLLFERPIDGLGFALDYMRGLREMGTSRKLELKARAGLHVGEVLTWRNSEEAVQVGAKPLEVEGLAKPMAARLMAVARPGQILLSAVAEPLAHRAARELGERGQHLLWKSHGRWRFKGMPDSQQIYEVGEPGIAPLRVPPNSPKAWRDIPLWRRPAALAAEAAVIAGIGAGVWFATRPAPAIAFNQRDWVVVADLRNLTGDRSYDDSLETALRISLEQSRYVNVMPDSRVEKTLAQMGRQPGTSRLDRATASEVALRDGARAVLLPTVASLDGKVRVSVEVVDPTSQATVFAESMVGKDPASTVRSMGEVSEELRQRLGETLALVQMDTVPLDKATTGNLDALRAFTLAQRAYAIQDLDAAEQHFRQALSLDPQFAMARIGLARVAYAKTDVNTALAELDKALQSSNRLTNREQLYGKAQRAMIRLDRDVIDQWQALAKLYPDFYVASFNTANLMRYANRYEQMREYSDRASAKMAITRPVALYYRAIAESALGRSTDADASFALARKENFPPVFVEPALLAASKRDFERARSLVAADGKMPPPVVLERRMAEMTFAADSGDWPLATRLAKQLETATAKPVHAFEWAARANALAVLQYTRDKKQARAASERLIEQAAAAIDAAPGREREAVANAMLYAGYVAAGAGDDALARRSIALSKKAVDASPVAVLRNMAAITEARIALMSGDKEAATRLLSEYQGVDALLLTRYWRQAATAGAAPALSTTERARAYNEWAAERPPVLEALIGPPGQESRVISRR
ncbi:putative peptide modification system cyclase [Lysobacter sp. LF1]|uniref:Peptide modification system cyclase n=1 Tax=Lysobacter stagni TaxID=3045172 RepID=A0ABT6XCR4_9GAMM|nr:putative peptide modification system cyclase [Lysobacter sp. LF1]MDI9237917.1 putative peptide modification system cyclase [Lysobacter sp. LF1]